MEAAAIKPGPKTQSDNKTAARPARRKNTNEQNEDVKQAIKDTSTGNLIRFKLRAGKNKDRYEREADHIADKYIELTRPGPAEKNNSKIESGNNTSGSARTDAPAMSKTHLNIQRLCNKCEEEVQLKADDELDEREQERKSEAALQFPYEFGKIRQGGKSLANRQSYEQHMGYDFSDVRIHTDSSAAALAKNLGAKAFTHGRDIVFGEGEYQPNSIAGQRLLAHELAHVVQQGRASQLLQPDSQTISHATAGISSTGLNMQAGLLDDAEDLWDSGTSFIADTARSGGRLVVSGARAVGGAAVRGAEFVGGVAVDAFNSVRDFVIAWLEEYAPALLSFMRGDIIGTIKDKILEGLDYLFNGFGTRIQTEGLPGALKGVFGELTGTVKQIAIDLSQGNCESLFSAINSIAGFGERLLGPAFDDLRGLLGEAGSFFSDLWSNFGAPAWDVIKTLAGDAWQWISDRAKWLWDQTAGLRSMASYIWEEYKRIFDLEWNAGEGSVTGWLRDKATEAWTAIKEALGPFLLPLQIAGAVFLLFTPMGPFIALGVGVPMLWEAIKWLKENWDGLEIVVTAREILHEQIMPGLQAGLAVVQSLLGIASAWLREQFGTIVSAINTLLATVASVPIVRSLLTIVSKITVKVNEVFAWLAADFASLLDELKELAKQYLKIMQPLAVLLIAIINFPVMPWLLAIVLTGWAWRILPDCLKPPIIDFWLENAIAFVNAMPDFEMFGPIWPQAREKIVEALQSLQSLDTEGKIEGSNRIAKMMTGEDFTWIANLARAAWKMPSHFMGAVQEELLGSNLNKPLPIEKRPEDALQADSGQSIDALAVLLNKEQLSEDDVEIDNVAMTTWEPGLLRELNLREGQELYLGDNETFGLQTAETLAAEQGVSPEEPVAGEEIAAEASASAPPPVEAIPEDPEEQLTQLMDKPLEMTCDDKEKKEEPAAPADVPAFARRYGPFTPMQRLRYLLNQMGKGISHWFDCNKHWLVPTLIVAIIALIVLIVVTEGAILGVLASVMEIVAAVLIGVSLVRMTAWVAKYVSFGIAGQISDSTRALAKALAIGAIELIFALLFSLGPILKGARAGFKGARAAGRGVVASVGAGVRSGAKATGAAVKSAVVPGFEATAKVGSATSKSVAATRKSLTRAGSAIIENGRIIIKGVKNGFARGAGSVRQLRKSLSKLRFNGFSISRKGMFFYLWGHFNPKMLVLVGPGHFEDVSFAGTGKRPTFGGQVDDTGRRFKPVVSQVPNEGANNFTRIFEAMPASERRKIILELQQAADDEAARAIMNRVLNRSDDLGFPSTTTAMRDAMQGKPYRDPLSNTMVHPPHASKLAPDHLFPVSKIRKMKGFDDLTPAQQKTIIQDIGNEVDNIRPLPRKMNESKSNRTGGDWKTFAGQDLNKDYIRWLAREQAAAEARIRAKINEFLQANGP